MVYTSLSLPLAALETFVHLDPPDAPADLVSLSAEIPLTKEQLLHAQKEILSRLPPQWKERSAAHTRQIGAEWAKSLRSVALPVPSVVIDGEWNLLLNPQHPGMKQIVISKPKHFRFDERMFKR